MCLPATLADIVDSSERSEETKNRVFPDIFESIPLAFYVLDEQLRFTFLNSQAEQLLGRNKAALIGQNIWQAFPELQHAYFYQQALAQTRLVEFEDFYPSLGERWLKVRACPVELGRPTSAADSIIPGLAIYLTDITDLKQAEQELEKLRSIQIGCEQTKNLFNSNRPVNSLIGEPARSVVLSTESENEERYHSLFDNSMDGVLLAVPEGHLLEANLAACHILGYEQPEEIIWLGRDRLVDLDDPDLPVLLEERARTGSARGELRFRHKNGSFIPCEIASKIFQLKNGEFRSSIIFRDISQRKALEQALRENEECYRSVITSLAEGVVLQQVDKGIVTCNTSAEKLLGLSLEQMQGRDSLDPRWRAIREDGSPFPGEEHPAMLTLRTGQPCRDVVMGVYKPDGQLTWLTINTQPLPETETGVSNTRSAPKTVVVSFYDITWRKQAESALQAERDFAIQVMQTMGQGLTVTNREGRIEFVNAAYTNLLGYSPQEIINRTPFELTYPDDRPELERQRQLRRQGQTTSYESRLVHRDGSLVYVNINGVPRWQDGKVGGAIAVVTDLTEQKKTEERQRRQNEYLAALHQTAVALMNRLDLTDLLQTIITRAGTLVGTEHGYIYLVEPGEKELAVKIGVGYHHGREFPKVKPGEGMAGKVWQNGQPLVVEDYSTWEYRISDHNHNPIHAVVELPLKSGDQFIGVLGLAYLEKERRFGTEQLELLEGFARLASLALDNSRLYTSLQRRVSELTLVQQVAQVINSSLQLEKVFETVVNQISSTFGYSMVSIYLRSGNGLILQAYVGYDDVISYIGLEQGISGRVASSGQALFIRDANQEPEFLFAEDYIQQSIIVPLKSQGGQVLGILAVESKGQPVLSEEDFTLLTLLSDQVSVAVENARLFVELQQSEQKYRDVVNNVKEIIFQTDLTGHWLFLNSVWEQTLGYSVEESLGKLSLEYVQPVDRRIVQNLFAELVKGKRQHFRQELQCRAKDGSDKWLEVFGQVIIGSKGQAVGVTGTLVDNTQRKQEQERRLTLERKLLETQKLESLGVLAGGIAHDFNNLLVGILGNAGLALLELPPEAPARQTIEQIELAAQRAAELTNQMLAYSGKGHFVIERLNLNSLISEMTHLLKASISKNVHLNYQLAPTLPLVEIDPAQIRQVVMNLIINASDAIGQQEGVIRITTGVRHATQEYLATTYLAPELVEGDYVFLEVCDTGSGMDALTLTKIFDPFFTTKFTGRGLGLASVLGIVRGHKGALKVSSWPGEGTTFQVLLPVVQGTESLASTEIEPPSLQEELSSSKKTILLIDDEKLVRDMTARLLERLGYKVLSASGGREGIELFRGHRQEIECVLLDMTMPDLNGEETFQQIYQVEPNVRVIVMSGYSEKEVLRHFKTDSLRGFVQKPYRPGELREKLEQVLKFN
jgi:PAS domain S-box-containing protein